MIAVGALALLGSPKAQKRGSQELPECSCAWTRWEFKPLASAGRLSPPAFLKRFASLWANERFLFRRGHSDHSLKQLQPGSIAHRSVLVFSAQSPCTPRAGVCSSSPGQLRRRRRGTTRQSL